MKKLLLLSLSLISVPGVEAISNTHLIAGLPMGTYLNGSTSMPSCRNCSYNKTTKELTCAGCNKGGWSYTKKQSVSVPTKYHDIENNHGILKVISMKEGKKIEAKKNIRKRYIQCMSHKKNSILKKLKRGKHYSDYCKKWSRNLTKDH